MNKSFLIILLILVWVSCSKKEDELIPDIKKIPTAAGTHWVYDRLLIFREFESEVSGKTLGTDTILHKLEIWVDKDTLLNDSMKVIAYKTRENDQPYTSSIYRFFDGDGLKTYAYSNPAKTIELKNRTIKLPPSPLNVTTHQLQKSKQDIIVEEIPLLDVRLPLKSRYSWIYKQPTLSSPLQIDKYVSGAEMFLLDQKEITCLKISWQYHNDPRFNGIKMTEWISSQGFMKVSTTYPTSLLTNEAGDSIGFFQFTDMLILKEFIEP